MQVPSELLARTQSNMSVYWKSLPLRPGLYKVDIVIKDVNNPDHIGTWRRSVNVPKYDDDQLSRFVADSGRPDGAGALEGHRRGQLRDRQYATVGRVFRRGSRCR